MPPRAGRRVAAAANAATAAPPAATQATAANKKRARGTATVEEADSDDAEAHSSSEERPTRRARGDSNQNGLGTVPSPSAGAATADGGHDPTAATATGRRSRSGPPAAAASTSAPIVHKAKGRKAGGAGADSSAAADPPAVHPLGDPLLAPVQRCDPDSLSLVFAMLNTADFLAAIRVCKGWHAARMKHTAWPTLHLPSFIQSLRDDDYDNPARRRLEVRLMHKAQSRLETLLAGTPVESMDGAAVGAPSADVDGASSSAWSSAAAAPAASPPSPSAAASMWRHAADMKLLVSESSFPSSDCLAVKSACGRALQQIAQLPYLSALNLHDCAASDDAVRDFFSAVASRLQALLLYGWNSSVFYSHLPLLRGLRVLVLNRQPQLPGLAQLTQLRYLHFRVYACDTVIDEKLVRTLRWLSQAHQLRSLSIDMQVATNFSFGLLFQPPVAAAEGVGHAPPAAASPSFATTLLAPAEAAADDDIGPAVDWSRPFCLTDVSLSGRVSAHDLDWLGRLPHLRRLQVESHGRSKWEQAHGHVQQQAHVGVLSRLRQLRLCLRRDPTSRSGELALPLDWRHLRFASQLRVLQLTSAHAEEVTAATLLAVVAACAATLEELRLGKSIRIVHTTKEEQQSASSSTCAAVQPTAAAASTSAVTSASAASGADADGAGAVASVVADSGVDASASEAPAAASSQLGAWSALARCLRLRVLQLELQSDTAASGLLVALSLPPAFQSLELTLRGKQRDGWPAHGFVLPLTLLHCITQSRSWCSLHIHPAAGSAVDLLRTAGGLAAQMPAEHADDATARRLRVYGHGTGSGDVRSYGIRDDGRGGGRHWQLL